MFLKALFFAFYPYNSLWINLYNLWSSVRSHPLIFLNMHMPLSSSIRMDRWSFLSWIALDHCLSHLTISTLRYSNTTQHNTTFRDIDFYIKAAALIDLDSSLFWVHEHGMPLHWFALCDPSYVFCDLFWWIFTYKVYPPLFGVVTSIKKIFQNLNLAWNGCLYLSSIHLGGWGKRAVWSLTSSWVI